MMAASLAELVARWESDEGKPYKGSLIDWSSYDGGEPSLGCMCAQGQVLHVVGGWAPERLRDADRDDADRETAKLLNISVAHAILLRNVNDGTDGAPTIVLTSPEKLLGDQASKLHDFWWHLDQMTSERRDAARAAARDAAWDAARDAAGGAARAAAGAAAWAAARDAAWDAAWAAARDAAWDAAWDAAYAASEIQGAHLLRERGKPFFFLPLFGFADPEAIPPRPANYGVAAVIEAVQS